MFDVIVVGSGPSGVAAALGLYPKSVLMLDVGVVGSQKLLPEKTISEIKKTGESFDCIIGDEFESLRHFDDGYLSPKLKGPLMRFILAAPKLVRKLDNFRNFHAHISYARGGLANAWGAGLMRYGESDLSGFPISCSHLDNYYDALTELVGISGVVDDLGEYYGSSKYLLPPLNLSPLSQRFLNRYMSRKQSFNKKGLVVGRPRLAVLSTEYRGRPAYNYLGQEFFQPYNPSIFNPSSLLDSLVKDGKLHYRSGVCVDSFLESGDGVVTVLGKDINSGECLEFKTGSLLLAAGTLNTTRIVLKSYNDTSARLPILDNRVSFIPFVDVGLVGSRLTSNHFPGAELTAVNFKDPKNVIQASVYGFNGVLRSDLISEFPLSFDANISLAKYLGPALGMMQVFYPDRPNDLNYICLNDSGGINVSYEYQEKKFDNLLFSSLYQMGYLTASFLGKTPLPGSSIHYAGTLPMKDKPANGYETDMNCRLNKASKVFIVDGSVFPVLPAKNHSFTLMANAMRVGEFVKNCF